MSKFTLPQLPYGYDALEPHFDAQTMEIHYTKHHQGYTDKLNAALENYDELQELSIIDLLKQVNELPEDIKSSVRNNGGGYFNHMLFWTSLTPNQKEPGGKLLEKIDSSFKNLDGFKEQFTQKAVTLFGSGWIWLVVDNDNLSIFQTPNQDNPIMESDVTILFGLDVWEHAYYLKFQNRRAEYIDAWWNLLNWEEVERRLLE